MKKKLLTDFNYWEQDIDTIQSNIKISQKDCHWIKDDYNSIEIKSFLDVPGWINDAQWIFKEVIENCSDGDRVVEIGTYFGQSACYMGMLIKDSGKDIKFDTYDTFEELDPSIRAGQQPKQFAEYRLQKGRHTAPMSTIVKSHFKSCGVDDYVNLIICDATYSYKFYKDNSLMLFYNDAVNNDKELYELITNFWPKIKQGGMMAGDDINFESVKNAVSRFCKDNNIKYEQTEVSWYIRKK